MAIYSQSDPGRKKINVLFYTSYRIILDSFETLLKSSDEIQVLASATRIKEIPGLLEKSNADVVVLCLMEDETRDIEIILDLQKISPASKFLVITCNNDIEGHLRAVQLGASGVMYKDQDGRTLLRAISQIHQGDTWFNQKLITRILNNKPTTAGKHTRLGQIESISKREFQIIDLIAKGLKNKAIGKALFISESTVRHHLSSIYGKLGVEDRLNLVIYAYQQNLVSIGDNPGANLEEEIKSDGHERSS
jgi:DNA-binding NarL/FixJ family response regulator